MSIGGMFGQSGGASDWTVLYQNKVASSAITVKEAGKNGYNYFPELFLPIDVLKEKALDKAWLPSLFKIRVEAESTNLSVYYGGSLCIRIGQNPDTTYTNSRKLLNILKNSPTVYTGALDLSAVAYGLEGQNFSGLQLMSVGYTPPGLVGSAYWTIYSTNPDPVFRFFGTDFSGIYGSTSVTYTLYNVTYTVYYQ